MTFCHSKNFSKEMIIGVKKLTQPNHNWLGRECFFEDHQITFCSFFLLFVSHKAHIKIILGYSNSTVVVQISNVLEWAPLNGITANTIIGLIGLN
jgi:hypothetical protein